MASWPIRYRRKALPGGAGNLDNRPTERDRPFLSGRAGLAEEVTVATAIPVLVLWQDAWFDSDQCGENDWRDDYLVSTVGFIVRDTDTVLSIAMERLPDEDGYRAVTHVPKGMIVEVRSLEQRDEARGPQPPTLPPRLAVSETNGHLVG
jgi:hypothetical protein